MILFHHKILRVIIMRWASVYACSGAMERYLKCNYLFDYYGTIRKVA